MVWVCTTPYSLPCGRSRFCRRGSAQKTSTSFCGGQRGKHTLHHLFHFFTGSNLSWLCFVSLTIIFGFCRHEDHEAPRPQFDGKQVINHETGSEAIVYKSELARYFKLSFSYMISSICIYITASAAVWATGIKYAENDATAFTWSGSGAEPLDFEEQWIQGRLEEVDSDLPLGLHVVEHFIIRKKCVAIYRSQPSQTPSFVRRSDKL